MFNTRESESGEIFFSGRLDAAQTEKADKALQRVTATRTIDLTELEYISSAGLGILLSHQKRLSAAGQTLKLRNLNVHLREIFKFTGFDRIFTLE